MKSVVLITPLLVAAALALCNEQECSAADAVTQVMFEARNAGDNLANITGRVTDGLLISGHWPKEGEGVSTAKGRV